MATGEATGHQAARDEARPAAGRDEPGPVPAQDEDDGQQPGRLRRKAAARALGAAGAAGLGAMAAAGLLDPRPATVRAQTGTGTARAHPGHGHQAPGHAPGPGHAPDLVVAPAAADPGYTPPPPPGTGQPGTAGGPGAAGQPATTGGGTAPAGSYSPGTIAPPATTTPPAGSALAAGSGTEPVKTSPVPAGPGVAATSAGGVPAASQPLPGPAPASAHAAGAAAPQATVPTAAMQGAAAPVASQNAGPWSVLYDAAGDPVGMANAAGTFSAFPGTDAASASAASPITLYDSAGQQAGTYSGASKLMPPATAQSPWLAGNPPPAASATQGGSSAPAGNTATQAGSGVMPGTAQQQAATAVQQTAQVPIPINQQMLTATPDQRNQAIRQFLQAMLNDKSTKPDQKEAIQQALDGNIPDLPDSFYSHGNYTYTDPSDPKGSPQSLDTLEAAATVAKFQASYSHFGVYIQDLSDTAGTLYLKGDDISIPAMSLGLKFAAASKMWDKIFTDLGDSSDPYIQAAQSNFTQMRNTLFGGLVYENSDTACYSTNTKGNIPMAAQGIRDQADQLYETAAVYAYVEDANLSQFGQPADDPRPAWEKARFTVTDSNGNPVPVDNSTTGKYPEGYFDPGNPGSPFYDGLGPRR